MDQYSEARTTNGYPTGATAASEVIPGQTEVAELMDKAKQTATKTAQNVGETLQDKMDSGVHLAGQRLEGAVKNLHEVADTLEERGNQSAADLIERAAEPAERVTKYLETTNTQALLADGERYAREHTWTVVIGGALLGVVASRFLKASLSAPVSQSSSTYRAA